MSTKIRSNTRDARKIGVHLDLLRGCRLCPKMESTPIVGRPVASRVMIVGQAPGGKEEEIGRPFAWTAGKTLFKWFGSIGFTEEAARSAIYIAAVCRCFPGKRPTGGDRVPDVQEIANCSRWLEREIELLAPALIIPVGKLAIGQFIRCVSLSEVVGRVFRSERAPTAEIIPLPHPSGASTWIHREPGKTLLKRALGLISAHPAVLELR